MSFKKLLTLNLDVDNGSAQIRAGDLKVSKGQNMRAIRLKVRAKLKNSGTARALDYNERHAFLASTFDYSLAWGAGQQHKPRSNVNFSREAINMRQLGGTEMEGLTDSVTGLARIINSTATDVVFYQRISLCELNKDQETDAVWGVGPTQALTIAVDFRRLVPTLPAGFSLDGPVYMDVIPDEFASKYDRVCPIARWHTFSEDNRTAEFPAGLPLYIIERSALNHVFSVLTDCSMSIDGLSLYSKASMQEWLAKMLDTPNYIADQQTFDRDTVLYAIMPGTKLRDFPTGKPIFEQDTQTLSKMLLGILYIEVIPFTAIEADVKEFARLKKRRVAAVSLATLFKMENLPKNLRFAVPYVLLDEADAELDRYPSLMCEPGGEPHLFFPESATDAVRARVQLREARREFLGAEDEVREFVLPIPGAVQDPRGFGQGSSKYLATARVIAKS
jgi:hypothetical protein